MTLLEWRDAEPRTPDDKRALFAFRCVLTDLKTKISADGVESVHERRWEYRVQEVVQHDVMSKIGRRGWLIRLGFDHEGLGGVIIAQELLRGEHYDLVVGAVATRLRGQHRGALGDEMLADMFATIGDRCASYGYSGEVLVTGIVHRDNWASKRMCTRNGLRHVPSLRADGTEEPHDDQGYEDWQRQLPIPDPPLFEDPDT